MPTQRAAIDAELETDSRDLRLIRATSAALAGVGADSSVLDSQALGPTLHGGYDASAAPTVEKVIRSWLSSAYERSHSQRTRASYAALIDDFRAQLRLAELDLDADSCLVARALAD